MMAMMMMMQKASAPTPPPYVSPPPTSQNWTTVGRRGNRKKVQQKQAPKGGISQKVLLSALIPKFGNVPFNFGVARKYINADGQWDLQGKTMQQIKSEVVKPSKNSTA